MKGVVIRRGRSKLNNSLLLMGRFCQRECKNLDWVRRRREKKILFMGWKSQIYHSSPEVPNLPLGGLKAQIYHPWVGIPKFTAHELEVLNFPLGSPKPPPPPLSFLPTASSACSTRTTRSRTLCGPAWWSTWGTPPLRIHWPPTPVSRKVLRLSTTIAQSSFCDSCANRKNSCFAVEIKISFFFRM